MSAPSAARPKGADSNAPSAARRKGRWLAAAGVASLAGCSGQIAPARDQWKVYVATDAPVPALGQQLFVEFIDGQGNDVSPVETRLIDGSRPELWPVSFGVTPSSPGQSSRIRVRLYRLDETGPDGAPQGSALIDATGTLPPLDASGVSSVTIVLAMGCFGVQADLAGHRSCDAATGTLAAEPVLSALSASAPLPSPGSWPPAAVVPCPSEPPAGMVCVPGGVFLMGAFRYFTVNPDLAPAPLHLVQLSPFALDTDEVTVGAVRGLVATKGLPPPPSADPDPTATPPECTYGGSDDGLPVTCMSWAQADKACELLGKRLPREAEWEYAAGNLGLKTPFPWGTDTGICADAIVARGRVFGAMSSEPSECLDAQNGYMPGPVAGGTTIDITSLGIKNLGGNVTEWVADVFDRYDGPCWTGSTLLIDPVCSAAVAGSAFHVTRGGGWQLGPFEAYTYEREHTIEPGDPGDVTTGFRCAIDL
jgi:formylglycine-generating enzyme required for sulfatase activity